MSASRFSEWDNPELGCITCHHVLEDERQVCFISHSGGAWALLCGDDKHYEMSDHELTAAHIQHIVSKDRSLETFSKLPSNRAAERKTNNSDWTIIIDNDEEWIPGAEDIVGLDETQLLMFAEDCVSRGVYFLRSKNSELALVSFDTGLVAIPIWRSEVKAKQTGRHRWPDDDVVHEALETLLDELEATVHHEIWIATDFLNTEIFYVVTPNELRDAIFELKI